MWLSLLLIAAGVLAQQKATDPDALYAEGMKFQSQNTPESLRAALNDYQQAVSAWQSAGNEPKEIDGLLAVGLVQFQLHDQKGCLKTLDESQQAASAAHDTLGEAKVHQGYALFYDALHELPRAISEETRSADLFHSLHQALEEAQARRYLATLAQKGNDLATAISQASQAADLFHLLGKADDEVQTQFALAFFFTAENDQTNAKATYERALPLATQAKNAQLEALICLNLGQLRNLETGEAARRQALALFERALPYFTTANDRFSQATIWLDIGMANDFLGKIENARAAYLRAVPLAGDLKADISRGQLFHSLGADELKLKEWAEAASHLTRAIPLLNPSDRPLAQVQLGAAREALEDPDGAIEAYVASATSSHTSGNLAWESLSWSKAGVVEAGRYHWREAIAFDRKAVDAAKTPGGASTLATALMLLSSDYIRAGEHVESLRADLEVLPLVQGKNKINTLITIGINYSWLAQYQNALKYLGEGLQLSEPKTAERAGILAVLSEVHTSKNELQEAEKEALESRDIYHALDVPDGEAKALNQLGLVYQETGEKSKSAAALNAALSIERAQHSTTQYATLNNLGDLERYFGDARKAEPLYRQALTLAEKVGDRYQEASILHNLGLNEHALGEESESLATLQRSLEIRRQLKDTDDEAKMLSEIGLFFVDTGKPQEGLDYLLQSLRMLDGKEDQSSQVTVLSKIASAYRLLGKYPEAETYFKRAEDLARQISDSFSQATILNNLATVELTQALAPGVSSDKRGELLVKSDELFSKALLASGKTGSKVSQTHILVSQAIIASERRHQQQALQMLQHAQALASETGDVDTQALAEHTTGTVYARLNDPIAALRHYRRALPLWKNLARVDGEEQTRYVMAKAERKQGHLEEALRDVQEAIRLSDDVRSHVVTDEQRSSLFATTANYYELNIDLLMQLAKVRPGDGYQAQAFEASERGRARSLLDLLAEAHTDILQGVDPKLLADEKRIKQSLATDEALRLKLTRSAETQQGQQELEKEIADLSASYEHLQAQIRAQSPAYASLTQPRPLTTKEIQSELLDPDTVLLEYALGEERSYLWIISNTSVDAYPLPPRQRIAEAARRLRDRILSRDPYSEEAAQLSRILLAPAAGELKRRIVIIADGELQAAIPFAVLPEPGSDQPLLVRHEIVSEPSASALAILRRNTAGRSDPPKKLAMIADPVFELEDERLTADSSRPADARTTHAPFPRLKNTGVEASEILRLGQATEELALIGLDANKNTVLAARLGDFRILHFATHGLINTEHPALSGLALSVYDKERRPIDGFLSLNDVYNLHLPVKLVVLSACESAQGEIFRGEGVMGLTRGFMYAGAKTLVVSLWNVDDASTAKLMRAFYQPLLAGPGFNPAASLRTAQLLMLHDERWKDPYYWAAFTVQGDWR